MKHKLQRKSKLVTKVVSFVLAGTLVFMMVPGLGLAQDPADPSEELVYDIPVENVVETPAAVDASTEEPAPAPDPVAVPDETPAPAADTAADTPAAAPAQAEESAPAAAEKAEPAAPAGEQVAAKADEPGAKAAEDEGGFTLMADYTLEYDESVTLTPSWTGGIGESWTMSPTGYANLNGRTVTNRNGSAQTRTVTVTHRSLLFPTRTETFSIELRPQKFDVKFFLQDVGDSSAAQIGDTQQVYRGSTATVPDLDATKTVGGVEYKLYSWYTDDTWATKSDPAEAINGASSFYAKYAAEAKIHYVKNTPEVAEIPDDQVDGVGNKVTLGSATTAGKALSSWNTKADGSGDSYLPSEVIDMPEGGLTLYAQWSNDTMTIRYFSNYPNEIDINPVYTVIGVQKNSRTRLLDRIPEPPRTYTFLGWSLSRNGDPEYMPDTTFETGNTSNVNFYAIWGTLSTDNLLYDYLTALGTEVIYDGKEHIIAGVEEGESDAHPGYVLVGEAAVLIPFDLYADISEIVASGTNAGSYSTPLTAQVYWESLVFNILEPVWTVVGGYEYVDVANNILLIKPVEISIQTNTEKQLYSGSPLTAGGTVTFTDAEGVTHEEAFSAEGGTVTLVNGETLNIRATGSQDVAGTSDNTYEYDWGTPDGWGSGASTAKSFNYRIVEETLGTLTVYYRIDFEAGLDAEEVTGVPESVEADGVSAVLPTDEPSAEHYRFAGWSQTEGAGYADYQPGDTVSGIDELQTDGVLTFYGVWVPKEYTVTYTDGEGGSVFADQVETCFYGEDTPEYTPTSTKPGYKFDGWDPEVATTVTGDATYTAIWVPDGSVVPDDDNPGDDQADETTYTITFDPNGGVFRGSTDPVSFEYTEGETITIPEAATRDGYTFQYWKGSKYMPGDSYTVAGDHTFVAQWDEDKALPPTGDGDLPLMILTLVLAAGAAATGTVIYRRRSQD